MEENKEHRISFFRRIKWAIFNLENYDFFAVEKQQKAFAYFANLILLFCIVICLALTYVFGGYYTKTVDFIDNEMPEFTFENGALNIQQEEVIVQGNEQATIIIDTRLQAETQESQELVKRLKTYPSGILFLKDKAMIKLPVSEEVSSYAYNEIVTAEKLTKTEVIEYIRSIPTASVYITFYITSVIYLFFVYFVVIALDVMLLSILGVLTSRMISIKLKFAPIVNISIYALTLPILLNAIYIIVNTITGFEIQYFQIMYNAISYIYLVTAILMIKSEMIKQQIELMKLAEEQKKVKEEIERQQEEEKEKEEQRKKEKEEEKKEEEKPSDDEAPEGTGA